MKKMVLAIFALSFSLIRGKITADAATWHGLTPKVLRGYWRTKKDSSGVTYGIKYRKSILS